MQTCLPSTNLHTYTFRNPDTGFSMKQAMHSTIVQYLTLIKMTACNRCWRSLQELHNLSGIFCISDTTTKLVTKQLSIVKSKKRSTSHYDEDHEHDTIIVVGIVA